MCDGTQNVKRYFFPLPNIFDTDTSTFSEPNITDTGAETLFRYQILPIPVPRLAELPTNKDHMGWIRPVEFKTKVRRNVYIWTSPIQLLTVFAHCCWHIFNIWRQQHSHTFLMKTTWKKQQKINKNGSTWKAAKMVRRIQRRVRPLLMEPPSLVSRVWGSTLNLES